MDKEGDLAVVDEQTTAEHDRILAMSPPRAVGRPWLGAEKNNRNQKETCRECDEMRCQPSFSIIWFVSSQLHRSFAISLHGLIASDQPADPTYRIPVNE